MVLSYSNVPVQTMQTIISRRIACHLVLAETVYFVMQTNTDPRKIARHLFCVCFGLGPLKATLIPEDRWSCKRSPDIWASYSIKYTKPGKNNVREEDL